MTCLNGGGGGYMQGNTQVAKLELGVVDQYMSIVNSFPLILSCSAVWLQDSVALI